MAREKGDSRPVWGITPPPPAQAVAHCVCLSCRPAGATGVPNVWAVPHPCFGGSLQRGGTLCDTPPPATVGPASGSLSLQQACLPRTGSPSPTFRGRCAVVSSHFWGAHKRWRQNALSNNTPGALSHPHKGAASRVAPHTRLQVLDALSIVASVTQQRPEHVAQDVVS